MDVGATGDELHRGRTGVVPCRLMKWGIADVILGVHVGAAGDELRCGRAGVDPWQFVDLLEGSDSFDRPIDRAFADIRKRYGVRVIRRGVTGDPTGPYAGLKIAFDRVPSFEEVDLFCGGSHG